MKITNAQDLHKTLRGFYENHVTALHGILEKLPEEYATAD